LEYSDLDGRIILRLIFRKLYGGMDVFSGLGYGAVKGTCESGNELRVFIKCGEFLHKLRIV
jgi:hypothetical protein